LKLHGEFVQEIEREELVNFVRETGLLEIIGVANLVRVSIGSA
jgi:hypothetical protein